MSDLLEIVSGVSNAPVVAGATPAGGGKHLVTDFEYDDLDRLTQVLGPEHDVRRLVHPAPGDEDPTRLVDPELLDRRVVEERLERPEPGDPGDELTDERLDVRDGRDDTGEAALVVVADDGLGDPTDHGDVALRVDDDRASGALVTDQVRRV